VLTEDFNMERKVPVSDSVVNRSLHSWDIMGRVACRKPLLSSRNVKKREVVQKNMVEIFNLPMNPNSIYSVAIDGLLFAGLRIDSIRKTA
jgi:hypothetical protein